MFDAHRHLTETLGSDAVSAAARTAPPVAVAGAAVAGVAIETWLIWASLAYVMLQAAYLVWKWQREWRRG